MQLKRLLALALCATALMGGAAHAADETYAIEGANASVKLSTRDVCYREKFGRNQQELAQKIGRAFLFGCPIKVHSAIAVELQARFDAITRAAQQPGPVQRWRNHLFSREAHAKGFAARDDSQKAALAKLHALLSKPQQNKLAEAMKNLPNDLLKRRDVLRKLKSALESDAKAHGKRREAVKKAVDRVTASAQSLPCFAIQASGAYSPGGHAQLRKKMNAAIAAGAHVPGLELGEDGKAKIKGGLNMTALHALVTSGGGGGRNNLSEAHAYGLAFDIDDPHKMSAETRMPIEVVEILERKDASGSRFWWIESDASHVQYKGTLCHDSADQKASWQRLEDFTRPLRVVARGLEQKKQGTKGVAARAVRAALGRLAKESTQYLTGGEVWVPNNTLQLTAADASPPDFAPFVRGCAASLDKISVRQLQALEACLTQASETLNANLPLLIASRRATAEARVAQKAADQTAAKQRKALAALAQKADRIMRKALRDAAMIVAKQKAAEERARRRAARAAGAGR